MTGGALTSLGPRSTLRQMLRRLALPLALASLALLVGCDKRTKGDVEVVAEPAGADDPQACTDYANSVCEKAGEKTSACQSVRETAKLLPVAACSAAINEVDYSLAKLDEAGAVCDDLWDKLCADIGEETDTCKMIRERAGEFDPKDCEGMLAEYDQVVEEVRSIEARNKPLDAASQTKLVAGEPPAFGPADAPVVIVAFSDFQCPYCSMAANAVTELKKAYPEKVRLVFRQFPLSFHPDAHLAAQASLAAHEQGKFWEFHDKLFANQKALKRADLEKYAEELKLDMVKFRAALDDATYEQQVNADMKLGGDVYVDGTPTMFMNGKRVMNATEFSAIKMEIDAELESAG